MSFTPISGGLSSALSGTVEPNELYERRIHAPSDKIQQLLYTILIVIISALIFVTVIAIYDVLRNTINNYYANIALLDPNSHNTPEEIERTQIANYNALISSLAFAASCLITALILIVIIVHFIHN